MRYLKYFALLGILVGLAAAAPAQVAVRVGIGPGYVAGPPVCPYGYYGYYPYSCAPYGYYGPEYFVGGVFIGAGPWYHGYYGPRYYGRSYYYGHRYYGGGYWHRGWDRGYRGGFRGGYGHGYHGGFHGHR